MQLVVREACRKLVAGDAAHLVTRETGQTVRSFIARELEALAAGSVVTLDFSGVGIIDFSCADECLAKLVTRLIAGEYGEKYLRLTGLGESQRENIHVALERKRLPALLVHPDGSWDCLGTITPHLRETLLLLVSRRRVSAREMVGLLGLELTAASTRLGSLHRLRLVRRRERTIGDGGREFVYEALVDAEGAGERGRAPWLRPARSFPGRSSRNGSSAGSRSCDCCGARRGRSFAASAAAASSAPGRGRERPNCCGSGTATLFREGEIFPFWYSLPREMVGSRDPRRRFRRGAGAAGAGVQAARPVAARPSPAARGTRRGPALDLGGRRGAAGGGADRA